MFVYFLGAYVCRYDKLNPYVIMLSLQAAFKAAKQTKDGRDEEFAALRAEFEVVICFSIAPCFSPTNSHHFAFC